MIDAKSLYIDVTWCAANQDIHILSKTAFMMFSLPTVRTALHSHQCLLLYIRSRMSKMN